MSHTEQMREAFEAWAPPAFSRAKTADHDGDLIYCDDWMQGAWVAFQELKQAALTAPAAEVPEAMGDEPELPHTIYGLFYEEPGSISEQDEGYQEFLDEAGYTADQLRTYAKQYAQWQSTRLRGGVPERAALTALFKDAMDWGRSYGQRANLSSLTVDDVSEAYSEKARAILALRPQAVPMTDEPQSAPKLIGWRTENFLWETDDPDKARNWEPNVGVLPIFEGDPNTKLTAAPQAPALDAGVVRDVGETGWLIETRYREGCGPTLYFCGIKFMGTETHRRIANLDRDVSRAVRFARREDAEKILSDLADTAMVLSRDWCRVAEHMWPDAAMSAQAGGA